MNVFTYLMNDVCFAKEIIYSRPNTFVLRYDDGTRQIVTTQKRPPPRIVTDCEKMDKEIISELLYNMTSAIINVEYPRQISWKDVKGKGKIKSLHKTWSNNEYDRTKIEVDRSSWLGFTKKNAHIIE